MLKRRSIRGGVFVSRPAAPLQTLAELLRKGVDDRAQGFLTIGALLQGRIENGALALRGSPAFQHGAQVADFAAEHDLKMVSVSDLIAWRQRTERLVERINEQPVDTIVGPAYAMTYSTPYDPMHHVAIVYGDILDGRNVPVRLQLESVLDDVFGKNQPLDATMKHFAERGRGIIVYLREGSVGVARQSTRPRSELEAAETEEHSSAQARQEQWREIGLGAQILKDLGVTSIRLLASRERHYVGLEGFDIKIEETEILDH